MTIEYEGHGRHPLFHLPAQPLLKGWRCVLCVLLSVVQPDRMPELLRAFDRYLAGAEDLPELFDHTFDGNLPEKERK